MWRALAFSAPDPAADIRGRHLLPICAATTPPDAGATVSPVSQTIVCGECGEESEGKAPGWHAYLFQEPLLPSERIVEQVAIYCPACLKREFDDAA